jgi:hypothetical protein
VVRDGNDEEMSTIVAQMSGLADVFGKMIEIVDIRHTSSSQTKEILISK